MNTSFVYKNPVYSKAIDSIRDCQIVEDKGCYYLIGTCPPYWEGPNPGIKLYSSDDLLNWQFERFLLKREALDEDVWYRDRFWAPEIHNVHDRYYLTFNCRNDQTSFPHSCGLAVADHILGPYTVLTHGQPLIKPGNDLTIFVDDDAKTYVFWSGIWEQDIDLASCTLLGEPIQCFTPEEGQWDEIGVEGPYVVKRKGTYYMFYSSWTRGYEIGYATSEAPLGPWQKFAGNPFFGAQYQKTCGERGMNFTGDPNSPYVGVGHNAIFTGPDGRDWLVCHYQEKGRREALGFDPIWFEKGSVKSNGPTYAEQSVARRRGKPRA